MPVPTAPRLAALVTLAMLLAAPALGSSHEAGHWENLGEDGLVWVPAQPPAATYLPPPDLGVYHNATEMVAAMHALAAARPDLFVAQSAGTSVQGRDVTLVTVAAPGTGPLTPRVLFDGAHHGDEVIGSEILVRFLQRIAAEYDTNATMRVVLSQVVIDVVPMVNPDGIDRVPTCNHYAECRKNARGVDLNRNYRAHWGGTGSSGDPGSATYRGPSPTSEPETQAITALLDARDYALYASLHSGAEMILWPWGHTTTPPPEAALYQQLGGELSAITGAPHGQVSRILYGVSGDSMDQAYGAADGWRALAVSPETYRGSGNAFDWWYLFNPAEGAVDSVVARWDRFLWHMAQVAPLYEPARLEAPDDTTMGPDVGHVDVVVSTGARRPLLGASLALLVPEGAARVLPASVALANTSAAQEVSFLVEPLRLVNASSMLRAGSATQGYVTQPLTLRLVQAGLDLALANASMGSPDTNAAIVRLDAGPFDRIEGTLTLRLLPEGATIATHAFDVAASAEETFSFDAAGLAGGDHQVEARAVFTAHTGSEVRAGDLRALASLVVERPQLDLDKRAAAASRVGEPLLVTTVLRNSGNMAALGVELREQVPPGYAYTTRDGPIPVPTDPLGRPAPTRVEARADGGIDLYFGLGDVAAGATKFAQYRLVPLVPGEHALVSSWSYGAAFASGAVQYEEEGSRTHRATAP